MRSAYLYNFLIEANIMAVIAILLMIPLRRFFRKTLGNSALCFGWLLIAIRLLLPLSLVNPLIHEIRPTYLDDTVIRPIAGQVKVRVVDAIGDLGRVFWQAGNRQAYADLQKVAVGVDYNGYPEILAWIWLASFGFVVNWYGDSLDGTFARVHNQQRKTYGFFIDHNVDCINEALMFIGLGLSPMMNMHIALLVLVAYLILSIYVYISAHLKNEFKLTYAKMGPTELRVIVIIVNTLYFFIRPFQEFAVNFRLFGYDVSLGIMDIVGIIVHHNHPSYLPIERLLILAHKSGESRFLGGRVMQLLIECFLVYHYN